MSNAKLTFLGAARNVTGSCYLLETDGSKIIIDCGYYQERDFKSRNWDPFPVAPDSIDALILTHAHLDHCGLLPRLVQQGFSKRIHCTPATADIAEIVLFDTAHIQEHDAEHKRLRHEREGRTGPYPVAPLYTTEDVKHVLPLFTVHEYGTTFHPAGNENISVTLHDAGHILGAAMVQIDFNAGSRRIIFSGDVGRGNSPIIRDPSTFSETDYVVVESTYGNRVHKDNSEIPEKLTRIINRANDEGGNVVIPSFAVERTQDLLYYLHNLIKKKKIPNIPVILDSPMAIKVTEVFQRHPELFDEATLALLRRGEHPCDLPRLEIARSTEESKAIKERKDSAVIIAGSGMCTGGRIKYHLKSNVSRPESTILFIGYQAVGTLGRQLLERPEKVRILGEQQEVKSHVEKINGFSAHGDRNEMLAWLSHLEKTPRRVFVTHGETEAALSFGKLIEEQKGWNVCVPEYKQTEELD